MNNTILRKCINELSAEKPRLDYLRGMLETLVEMQPDRPGAAFAIPPAMIRAPIKEDKPDDAAILDSKARAAIETVKALAEKSLE